MPAYLIAFHERTHDQGKLDEYVELATPIALAAGVKPLIRYGRKRMVEGPDCQEGVLMLEFETFEKAEEFYFSPAYQEVVKLRLAAADYRTVLVEGM